MYKFLAFLGGVDSSVGDDVDAGADGESSALPSASIDPSAAADQRKAKVQKTTNKRNITAGVVTQPHHSPQRSPTRKASSPIEAGPRQSSLFASSDSESKRPPTLKRVDADDDILASKPRSVSKLPPIDSKGPAAGQAQFDNALSTPETGSLLQPASQPSLLNQGEENRGTSKPNVESDTDNSPCVYAGMPIYTPGELFDTVESVFLVGGMRLSDLRRTVKGSFDKQTWAEQFNLDGFVRREKNIALFKRGKWTCGHPGCTWNVAASFMSAKKYYEILDGPKEADYNTNLCLVHNHEADYAIVDGVQEITHPKDLRDEEMEVLRNAALINSSMPSVQHGLALKCGTRDARIYNAQMLHRVITQEKIRIHGTDHHRIPELMQRGRQTRQRGGEFGVDVDDVYRINGTRYQTRRMKQYAQQYGSYFAIVDGTYGTNQYGLTAAPWVGADCLGRTVQLGISTSLSENIIDMTAAGQLFSISSTSESEEQDSVREIDGVKIDNTVAMNSYKGSLYTDKGPWAEQTAVGLGKFHGFCTRHETNNIPAACAGQQNYDACFKDLNALIYGFTSVKELETAFVACRRKYGHLKPAAKFIDAIETDRHKLCRAYTQYIFSLNHTSTQRGEGFNDVIKGHKDLIPMLANADLVTLHDHLLRLALETDATIIKILAKLRKREKRWSDIYEEEVNSSIQLCTTNVKTIEHKGDSTYEVVDTDGDLSCVNLDTKIVHRGDVYIIPTCNCGYFCSSFRICKCIVKALVTSGRKILVVSNIHPYHLLHLHPLWPEGLRHAQREEYDDVKSSSSKIDSTVDSRKASAQDSRVVPNEFWTVKRVAKDNKRRVQNLRTLSEQLIKFSVNNGDEDTYKRAHARLSQATAEVLEMIQEKTGSAPSAPPNPPADGTTECLGNEAQNGDADSEDGSTDLASVPDPHPPAMPVKNRQQRARDNMKNNSALYRSVANGKAKGKSGKSKNKGGQKAVGEGNIIQRRLLNGQKSGGESNHKRPSAPGSSRQNPIQAQLLARRGGNRGGSAVAHGNRSRAAGARSDGVGDFGFNVRPVFPGYDIKPEGVSAETDTIEGHNIPKKGQAPYAI